MYFPNSKVHIHTQIGRVSYTYYLGEGAVFIKSSNRHFTFCKHFSLIRVYVSTIWLPLCTGYTMLNLNTDTDLSRWIAWMCCSQCNVASLLTFTKCKLIFNPFCKLISEWRLPTCAQLSARLNRTRTEYGSWRLFVRKLERKNYR